MKQKKMFLMMAVLLLAFMFAGCAGDTVEDDTADNPEQEASVEELLTLPELNRRAAEYIYTFFHKNPAASSSQQKPTVIQ